MNESIISKLKKLLALAGNNKDENEAQAAMEKAQKLALEHDIELSKVAQTERNHNIVKGELDNDISRLPVSHKFVADIIESFFNVSIITSGGRKTGRKIFFIGKQQDVDFAKFLNNFLNETFLRMWHVFYKKHSYLDVKNGRQSYFYGLYIGLKKKLQEQKEEILKSALVTEQDKNNYQLMVIDDKKLIELAVIKFFPELRKGGVSKVNIGSNDALEQGKRDGRTINVHGGLKGGEKVLALHY